MPKYSPGTPKPNDVKFVKEYIKHGNGTQAALEAYNTNKRTTAQSKAYKKLKKPEIREMIREEMAKQGIDAEYVAQSYHKLLEKGLSDENLEGVKIAPNDTLKGLEHVSKLLGLVGGGGLNNNKSVHLHQHLHNAPRKEVLEKYKENKQYFESILEEE